MNTNIKMKSVRKTESDRIEGLMNVLDKLTEHAEAVRTIYTGVINCKDRNEDYTVSLADLFVAMTRYEIVATALRGRVELDLDLRMRFDFESDEDNVLKHTGKPLAPLDKWPGPAGEYLTNLGLLSAIQLVEFMKVKEGA